VGERLLENDAVSISENYSLLPMFIAIMSQILISVFGTLIILSIIVVLWAKFKTRNYNPDPSEYVESGMFRDPNRRGIISHRKLRVDVWGDTCGGREIRRYIPGMRMFLFLFYLIYFFLFTWSGQNEFKTLTEGIIFLSILGMIMK
jgi:hypothetical protein